MDSDQQIVATMSIGLILLVLFGLYKPYLKSILFTSPTNNPSISSWVGSLPGQFAKGVGGYIIGPNGELQPFGGTGNPWAPF